jgi:hypothetical protein
MGNRGRTTYDYRPESRFEAPVEVINAFHQAWGQLSKEISSLKDAPVYIASFSEHKDVLSQWRGYCGKGNGYSIGFMPPVLTD